MSKHLCLVRNNLYKFTLLNIHSYYYVMLDGFGLFAFLSMNSILRQYDKWMWMNEIKL